MFIPNMPSPLHLRQLVDVIHQAVMDDTAVAEMLLATLQNELSVFLWVEVRRYYPRESRSDPNLALMIHRKTESGSMESGDHGEKLDMSKSWVNGCIPRVCLGMHQGISASSLMSSVFPPLRKMTNGMRTPTFPTFGL